MSAARPETGATLADEKKGDKNGYGYALAVYCSLLMMHGQHRLASVLCVQYQDIAKNANPDGTVIDRSQIPVEGKGILLDYDYLIITRAYLDALTALLDAGCSVGVADGRWAREGLWQDAEDEKDAAREEMGL